MEWRPSAPSASWAFTGSKRVAVAAFTLTPPAVSVAVVSMIEAVLPTGFEGVQGVTVVQGDPEVQALVVDSVTFALEVVVVVD